MFYAAMRKYSVLPEYVEEVMQRIARDFLPVVSQLPDYLEYFALRVGNSEVMTISIFFSLQAAQDSNPIAHEWVEKNIARYIQAGPEVTVGQVLVGAVGAKL